MAESPTFEFQDVPAEERLRFCELIGENNGPAATIGKWDVIMQLPGLAPRRLSIEGAKNEGVANLEFTREGSTAAMGGPMRRVTIDGIDPIRQDF
jgi:hypothetical protein